MHNSLPASGLRPERIAWYACIICGMLDDYDPSQICREHLAIMEAEDERLFLLSLLREAVSEIQTISLRQKIERVLAVSKRSIL